MDDDLELQARALELEAEALELENQKSNDSGGFWDNAIPSWGDVGNATLDMLKLPYTAYKGIQGLGESAAHFVSGVNGNTGEYVDRGAMLQSGAETLQALPMSIIPGGRALNERFKESIGYESPKSYAEYGQMVKGDLAALPAIGAGTYGISKIGAVREARNLRSADKTAAFADDASQAALRYSDNAGILDPSTKQAWESGKFTPEVEVAARQAQEHAILSKTAGVDRGMDYLPGNALGYPENNAGRSFAASEDMAKAGTTMLDSGLYTGGERINPFTGKFDGAPTTPLDNYALANKMELASADIIQARQGTVNALDAAMNDINAVAQNPAQRVAPIMFEADVAPLLGNIQQQIGKRALLMQTAPMSEALGQTYAKVQKSFNDVYQGLSSLGHQGTKTGVRTSEALGMLENMNAYRRSLGEFDEIARASGLNSTPSQFASLSEELAGLGQIQKALQTALETKASEILTKKALVADPKPWQGILSQVTDQTLPTMNNTYGAFQTGKEAAITYGNTTMRSAVAPEGGRLNTAVQGKSSSDIALDAAQHPIRETARAGLNALGFGGRPPTPMANAAGRNLARPNAAISQVLDGLLLRDKPIPILSRSWEQIKTSPLSLKELGNRAVMYGLLPFGVFETLSEPMKKEVAKQVVMMNPMGAEQVAGNYQVFDGQYLNPMEKDLRVQNEINNPDVTARANIIGNAFQNKYVPPPNPEPVEMKPTISTDIDMVMNSLNGAFEATSNYGDASSMTNEMKLNQLIHAQDG